MAKESPGKAVEVIAGANSDLIDNSELNKLSTVAEAMAILGIADMSTEERDVFLSWDTNPWEPVDKEKLIDTPLFLAQWRFIAGDFGEYVIVYAFAELGNGSVWQVLFTDGSAGIYNQLRDLTNARIESGHSFPQNGAMVKGGIVRSDYEYEDKETGEMRPATTFYLSNRKK